MRAKLMFALVFAAGLGAAAAGFGAFAKAPAYCIASPQSIGLARTVEVDAKGGARFGLNQYPSTSLLNDGEVVLTFDDGPHKVFTPSILETLDAHCTKATFFMVGQRALQYPDLVRAVAQHGHSVATHTWSHQNLSKIPQNEALTEVELGISAVQRALGSPAAPFFRFPYLSDPQALQVHLRGRDTGIFSIDVDSHDYLTRSPTLVIRNVLQQLQAKRQGIILFHDIQPSTAGALNQLLAELKIRGFRVVHMVPKHGQTTLAQYDAMAAKNGGGRRLASLPVPVAQRGIVSPGWDAQIDRGQAVNSGAARPQTGIGLASPPSSAVLTRRPVRVEDDWRSTIFRHW